jgi:hypothetical protein
MYRISRRRRKKKKFSYPLDYISVVFNDMVSVIMIAEEEKKRKMRLGEKKKSHSWILSSNSSAKDASHGVR